MTYSLYMFVNTYYIYTYLYYIILYIYIQIIIACYIIIYIYHIAYTHLRDFNGNNFYIIINTPSPYWPCPKTMMDMDDTFLRSCFFRGIQVWQVRGNHKPDTGWEGASHSAAGLHDRRLTFSAHDQTPRMMGRRNSHLNYHHHHNNPSATTEF